MDTLMRSDLEAAARLAQTLPSRIHEQRTAADLRGDNMRTAHWNEGSGRYQRKGMPVNRPRWGAKPKIRTKPAKVVNGRGRGGCNR